MSTSYDSIPDIKSLLQKLIATPSISSQNPKIDQSNRPIINELANWLDDLGFKIEILPISDQSDKTNLVATFGEGTDGLILSGHVDTVPFDSSGWDTDPFKLTEKDNKFYGLGTADMKGFFAIAIEAIKPLLDQPFKKPLTIVATADEESSMAGARALLPAHLSSAKFALIGEPTGLQPIHMHKGIMLPSVHIIGKSAHSSMPHLGKNALETMHEFINQLLIYRSALAKKHNNNGFDVSTPTMNLGCIHGGDNANRICGDCHLSFDVRLIPGMDSNEIKQAIQTILTTVCDEFNVKGYWEEPFAAVPPFSVEANHDFIQLTEQLSQQKSKAVNFTTEAPFFQQLGITPVVLGPGHIEQAHQTNEFLALDQIDPAIKLLRKLIQKICFTA